MRKVLISVIIPMYNSEKYIAETIESVLTQKDIGYEIIIVNDGSTDHSPEICTRYLRDNVKLINQENSGAPTARNRGLKEAIGKYLLFLDSDDTLCEGLFESLEGIVCGEYSCIIGNFIRMISAGSIEDISYSKKVDLFSYYYLPPYPCNKLYLKETVNKYSIIFDNIRITQDLNFYYKMLGVVDVDSIIKVDYFFVKYRWVDGSISHSISKKILDVAKSIDACESFYNIHNAKDRLKYLYLAGMRHVCYQIEKTAYFDDLEEGKTVYKRLLDYWYSLLRKTDFFVNRNYAYKKIKAIGQLFYTSFCVKKAFHKR